MSDNIKGVFTEQNEVNFSTNVPIEVLEDESGYVILIDNINNEDLEDLSVKEKMITAKDSIDKLAVVVNTEYKSISQTTEDTITDETILFEYKDKIQAVFDLFKAKIIEQDELIREKTDLLYEQEQIINNLQNQ